MRESNVHSGNYGVLGSYRRNCKRRVSLVGEAGRHQTMQDLIGKLKSLVFKNMRSHHRVLSKRVAWWSSTLQQWGWGRRHFRKMRINRTQWLSPAAAGGGGVGGVTGDFSVSDSGNWSTWPWDFLSCHKQEELVLNLEKDNEHYFKTQLMCLSDTTVEILSGKWDRKAWSSKESRGLKHRFGSLLQRAEHWSRETEWDPAGRLWEDSLEQNPGQFQYVNNS